MNGLCDVALPCRASTNVNANHPNLRCLWQAAPAFSAGARSGDFAGWSWKGIGDGQGVVIRGPDHTLAALECRPIYVLCRNLHSGGTTLRLDAKAGGPMTGPIAAARNQNRISGKICQRGSRMARIFGGGRRITAMAGRRVKRRARMRSDAASQNGGSQNKAHQSR